MARDMDLIRTLLVKVEALDLPPGTKTYLPFNHEWFQVEGHDLNQVVDNLRMLHDGGFVAGKGSGMSDFGLEGLTWSGAEFLDTIRNPEIWTRTKAGLKKMGGAGLEVAAQLAKAEAKRLITEKLGIFL